MNRENHNYNYDEISICEIKSMRREGKYDEKQIRN